MDRRGVLIGGASLALSGVGAGYVALRQMGSMQDYDAAVAVTRRALSAKPELRELIRYASLAPSGHNTQPWRFRIAADCIEILPDFARRTPVVDPDDHHLFVSLGCATETLALALGQGGDGKVGITGKRRDSEAALFGAVRHRQSTRTVYDGRMVPSAELRLLAQAGAASGIDLVLLTDRRSLHQVRDLIVEGNSAQMADPRFMSELKTWMRFSPVQALKTGDGLFSATSGNPVLPAWLGPPMFDGFFRASAENDKYARQMRSSSGVAVFVSQRADREHWLRVGRACQRFALQATALGLKYAFVNQPVEVARLRPELAELVGMAGRRPDIVMRFGYAAAAPFSARRQVEKMMA